MYIKPIIEEYKRQNLTLTYSIDTRWPDSTIRLSLLLLVPKLVFRLHFVVFDYTQQTFLQQYYSRYGATTFVI